MIRYKSNSTAIYEPLIRKIEVSSIIGKKRILNVAASFDTEVSSFYSDASGDEVALVYVWMFGIGDAVVYGRTLDELQEFIYVLNEFLKERRYRLIVYIHNMKYDFQFIRKLFKWDTVFMKAKRNPLYARTGNIEFRDSLVLAGGRSLAYIGKHLKTHNVTKAVGELDYNLIRHSETLLTDEELDYCERDILTLNAYIEEKINEDGDITQIPYTNTGYVRRYVKNACLSEHSNSYLSLMDNLTLTPGAYQQCVNAFVGGAVGANPNKICKTLKNVISYDIKSSYPYVMATQTYPMGFPIPVSNKWARSYLVGGNYHCIFRLTVHDLHPREWNDFCFPISQDKCRTLVGARIKSNRVEHAASLSIECTELDYDTFCKFYQIDESNSFISNMRAYPAGRLPQQIVKCVFEFFNKKTTLDGVGGFESEYMVSKNMLNAIYGMMVERPIRPKFMYLNGNFVKDDIDYEEQIETYNEKRDRVLYYPWGVYVTAWARHRLYDAIYAVGNRYVYCDTDSVKFELTDKEYKRILENGGKLDETIHGFEYFKRVNKQAEDEILKVTEELGLSPDYTMPRNPKGSRKILGVWEKEYIARRFKTLGPKRYLVEYENGEMGLTVAGTNKDHTLYYLINNQFFNGKDMFATFNDGLVIPKEYAKRLVATYIDDDMLGYVTDYLGNRAFYNAPSGVHMVPASYTFSLSDDIREELIRILGEGELDYGEIEY